MHLDELNITTRKRMQVKLIPWHIQKRCTANISQSSFNQTLAKEVYKGKVKNLMRSNKHLASALQSCRLAIAEKDFKSVEAGRHLDVIYNTRFRLREMSEFVLNLKSSMDSTLQNLVEYISATSQEKSEGIQPRERELRSKILNLCLQPTITEEPEESPKKSKARNNEQVKTATRKKEVTKGKSKGRKASTSKNTETHENLPSLKETGKKSGSAKELSRVSKVSAQVFNPSQALSDEVSCTFTTCPSPKKTHLRKSSNTEPHENLPSSSKKTGKKSGSTKELSRVPEAPAQVTNSFQALLDEVSCAFANCPSSQKTVPGGKKMKVGASKSKPKQVVVDQNKSKRSARNRKDNLKKGKMESEVDPNHEDNGWEEVNEKELVGGAEENKLSTSEKLTEEQCELNSIPSDGSITMKEVINEITCEQTVSTVADDKSLEREKLKEKDTPSNSLKTVSPKQVPNDQMKSGKNNGLNKKCGIEKKKVSADDAKTGGTVSNKSIETPEVSFKCHLADDDIAKGLTSSNSLTNIKKASNNFDKASVFKLPAKVAHNCKLPSKRVRLYYESEDIEVIDSTVKIPKNALKEQNQKLSDTPDPFSFNYCDKLSENKFVVSAEVHHFSEICSLSSAPAVALRQPSVILKDCMKSKVVSDEYKTADSSKENTEKDNKETITTQQTLLSLSDGFNEIGRDKDHSEGGEETRKRRKTVVKSYKEPSLHVKMRRLDNV